MGNTSKIVGRLLLQEAVSDVEAAKLLGFNVEEEMEDTECDDDSCDDSCCDWPETDDEGEIGEDDEEVEIYDSLMNNSVNKPVDRGKLKERIVEGAKPMKELFETYEHYQKFGNPKVDQLAEDEDDEFIDKINKDFYYNDQPVSKEDLDAWFEELRARDTGRKTDVDRVLFDSIGFQKFMYERMLAKFKNKPVDEKIKERAEDLLSKSLESFKETMDNINARETGPHVPSFTRMNFSRRERVEQREQEEHAKKDARRKEKVLEDQFGDLQDAVDDMFLDLSFEEVYAFIFDRVVNKFSVVFSDLWISGDAKDYGIKLEDTVNQLIDYLDHRVSLIATHPKVEDEAAEKPVQDEKVDLYAIDEDLKKIQDELVKQKVKEHQEKIEAEKEADRLWRKGVDEFIKQKQADDKRGLNPFDYPLKPFEPPFVPNWPYPANPYPVTIPGTGTKPWPECPGIGTPYIPGTGTAPAWNPPYIITTCTACANGGVCNCILNGQVTYNSEQK